MIFCCRLLKFRIKNFLEFYLKEAMGAEELPPVVMVGNKCDLEDQRVISTEQGREKSQQLGYSNAIFIEASAKTNVNIDEVTNCQKILLNDI